MTATVGGYTLRGLQPAGPGRPRRDNPVIRPTRAQVIHAIRRACSLRFSEFMRTFWTPMNPQSPVLSWNWHMDVMCDALQECGERLIRGEHKKHDLLINICPASTKSTISSVGFRVWMITRMPNVRSLYISHGADLALELSMRTTDFMRTPAFQEVYPEIVLRRDLSNKGEWGTTSGAISESKGIGQSPTGKHFHFIGIDDPIDPTSAERDMSAKLELANNFVMKTLPSRMIDNRVAFQFQVMQRLHQNDPTHQWLSRHRQDPVAFPLKSVVIPAEVEDLTESNAHFRKFYKDGLMDPQRNGAVTLAARKIALGPVSYSGQYRQNPIPKEGRTFKVGVFRQTQTPPAKVKWDWLIRGWDKAATVNKRSCYTAGVLIGKTKDPVTELPVFWILDLHRARYLPDDREAAILSVAESDRQMYGSRRVRQVIEEEGGGAGKADADATVRRLLAAGHAADSVSVSGSKDLRAQELARTANRGGLRVAPGHWNEVLFDEMEHFPGSTFKDIVDASSLAFNYGVAPKKKVEWFG